MSPFRYLPTPPVSTDEDERRRTADILARTVTPAPTSGVLPAIWCIECGTHLAESPTKPCPACAPNPRPLPPVPLFDRLPATPLEESS